jgi:hypothetical protein
MTALWVITTFEIIVVAVWLFVSLLLNIQGRTQDSIAWNMFIAGVNMTAFIIFVIYTLVVRIGIQHA